MRVFYLIITITLAIACSKTTNKTSNERAILLADREAPIGWIYLRVFQDQKFEYERRGLRRTSILYSGTVKFMNDTLYFNYKDTIPKIGSKAIIKHGSVLYVDGEHRERLEIKLNELMKK